MAQIKPLADSYEDFEYPEWEQQEGEAPKQKHTFDLFCAHGGSVRHFARDMVGVQKGDIFRGVKVKYVPYSEYTIRELARVHCYLKRRDAKESYEIEYLNKQMDEIEVKSKLDRFEKIDDAETVTIEIYSGKLESNELNGTQSKDYTSALLNIRSYKDELRGKSKETKVMVKGDVGIDAKAEVNGVKTVKLNPEEIGERDLALMKKFMESKQ